MGRAASHITLECALQTHPNIIIIGEEVWHCLTSNKVKDVFESNDRTRLHMKFILVSLSKLVLYLLMFNLEIPFCRCLHRSRL